MKIFWTQNAKKELLQIEEFIAADNPSIAIDFVDELINMAETLAEFPTRGRVVPEFSQTNIRELLYKNFRIVYLINKNKIEILTIFEGHRLLSDKDIS
ncbi:MAG: type II toxin-antitoxin system RelE/ParE family toxin [Melioribacteraceae bacterium]|nr:type II toxin-antitoxin system RelE/ParE family toxin [Melioribacteraceae bacterium]